MTGPPEGQEKAPKGGETLRGARSKATNTGTVGMFPAWVKCVTLHRWPLWMGSTWLRGLRRCAP